MKKKILVVDDDRALSKTLKSLLEGEGYSVRAADSAEDGLMEMRKALPDLIVLDIKMPGMDGFEFCRKIRAAQEWKSVPIIFLTSKEEEISKVLGLELGGDDYMSKPYSPRELLARIKAVLRRLRPESPVEILKGGAITVNMPAHTVTISKKKLALPQKEYKLLCLFLQKKKRVLSRIYLLENIWGHDYENLSTHTLETHIYRLRKNLEKHGKCIQAVDNLGYKWEDL